MVRPPWPNSTNRSSWLRPSAFHQYQVWPPQPQEQLNPFSQYNHVDVGHYVNPNIVQPTTQSQRVTAMKLEISPELPIQPSIQGNKLFVAVPAEARTIGEFKEHVAAILNVSSSVFHFTTGEFRIPDEEVIGILSCVSDQRINVVRSVRNWQAPGTPSRSRFPPIPPQSIENIQHSAATIESPPSRVSRMRSPPRLTHPLPCRPPRISPKHVPSSSNDISAEDTANLPTMPVPMSFSQMKYRINKQTSDESTIERRTSAAEGSSSSLVKRTMESHRINENGASTSSAVGQSHTHSHPIPIAVNTENETEQSQSTTPEIQVTDGSCTVYQVSAAATGDAATGKLRLLYCETINDNVNVPGTSTNGLPSTVGPPPGFGPLAKEKNSSGMNGNSQWTGVRLQVNNETITSAFASVSTSNSPLNLSSVTKPFTTDGEREAIHGHLQMPNISAERDLSNEQRQTHSSFSQFNSLSSNNNVFSRNNRSSYVFGSTSPLIGSSFRSIPVSPTNSIHNELTRSSSSKNKQQDLFSAPSSSSFIRAEHSSGVSSRTPWNIYRTFGIIEPDTSKSFCSTALNTESAHSVPDISSNGNLNQSSSSNTAINNHSRSPGIIQTKRRRICAIDSASIVYLHEQDDDKSVEDEPLNSKPSGSSNSATTPKHTQKMMNTHTDAHSTDKRRLSNFADDNFPTFRSTASNQIVFQQHPPISYYKNKHRPEAAVPKSRRRNFCRRRPKLSKPATATVTQYDMTENFPLRDPVLMSEDLLDGEVPSTSKSNNLILEDIESEDSQNELPVKDDVDIKILCEVGKESAFYKEDRPVTAAEDISVGSLIVFNEKIGSKDDCDCLVLSKRKWAKVISIESSETSSSFMMWFFSPFMKRKSQTNDKKDYVRLGWDDLVDPRIVVTKNQGDSEESE